MRYYDSACYDLAKLFLGDVPGTTAEDIAELAEELQSVAEDACGIVEKRWLRGLRDRMGTP